MGQKVHPYVLRIGFGKTWQSRWFSGRKREFAAFLEEDVHIRKIVKDAYQAGSVAEVIIERVSPEKIRVKIRTSRPGVIIGRRGQDIERVKGAIAELTGKEIQIDVLEVATPQLDAQLVAEMIGFQLIKRVAFRRAMKKAIFQAFQEGCEGIKMQCSGRLGGAEIARSESYKQGKVPLQTFRSNIDYGYYIARTPYGTIGIKVWVYRGEARPGAYMIEQQQANRQASQREPAKSKQ